MKTKYTLFRRGEMFYMQDSATGKQTSLRTKDETEATSLLEARNAAQRQPVLNLHLARAYLTASDTAFVERTCWNGRAQNLLFANCIIPKKSGIMHRTNNPAFPSADSADVRRCPGFYLRSAAASVDKTEWFANGIIPKLFRQAKRVTCAASARFIFRQNLAAYEIADVTQRGILRTLR